MNLFELTRALVDIESITDNEERVGEFLFERLQILASRTRRLRRKNAGRPSSGSTSCAFWGEPTVTFSTHIDTVPPFFASREDDEYIWGRGACDTKGIIAAMIHAVEGCSRQACATSACSSSSAKSATAPAPTPRPSPRADRSSSSTASPPKTSSRSARKAPCATRSSPTAGWRTRPIPSWANPPSRNLLDALAESAENQAAPGSVLGAEHAEHRHPHAAAAHRTSSPMHAKAEIFIRLVDDRQRNAAKLCRPPSAGSPKPCEVLGIPAVRLGSLEGFETTVVVVHNRYPGFRRSTGASRSSSAPAPFTSRTRPRSACRSGSSRSRRNLSTDRTRSARS